MTRWHASLCTTPDIVVTNDKVPSCRACGRTCPSAKDLFYQQRGVSGSWGLPTDEDPSHRNLRWPLSVPYVRTRAQHPQPELFLPGTKSTESSVEFSDVYGSTLDPSEIRLACLSAVPDVDYPLHLTLETFADNHHPEYECTSYSWGGEDGDSLVCRPIYIGEHWDVLLQTKNCLSMLRFLRPCRGIRMVWIDAVCINQRNTEERGAQVAKMRQIYEACSRVVLYLGDDTVTRFVRFPTLRRLDALEHDELLRVLRELLSRRYFSRVWVIQELIVSERVVIRIGDIDFRADAHIIGHLSTARDDAGKEGAFPWSDTPAPWFRHLAHKVFPRSEVSDVLGLLKLTANSSSSDPRDRLFGVVSLLDIPDLQTDLKPDYSLSFPHFAIGSFAHLLIKERRYWFLGSAGIGVYSRQQIRDNLPSWMPDCRYNLAWRELFLGAPSGVPSSWLQNDHAPFCLYSDEANTQPSDCDDNDEDEFSWPLDAIDAPSGALIMSAAHLISLKGFWSKSRHGPLFVYTLQRQTPCRSLAPSGLQLVSLQNLEIQPNRDHLYIPVSMPKLYLILRRTIDTSSLAAFELVTSCVRLFDRRLSKTSHELDRWASQEQHDAESWSKIGAVPKIAHLQMRIGVEIGQFQRLLNGWSQHKLHKTTKMYQMVDVFPWEKRLETAHADPKFTSFFLWSVWEPSPGPTRAEHDVLSTIIALCLAMHQDEIESNLRPVAWKDNLESKYLECLNNSFLHRKEKAGAETYIEFTLRIDDWTHRGFGEDFYKISKVVGHRNCHLWTWRHEREDTWHEAQELQHELEQDKMSVKHSTGEQYGQPDRPQSRRIMLRIRTDDFIPHLRSFLWEAQHILRTIVVVHEEPPDLETLVDLIRYGPEDEHESTGMGHYMADIKTDGRVSRIRIV
jgi:hypothetical protein